MGQQPVPVAPGASLVAVFNGSLLPRLLGPSQLEPFHAVHLRKDC